MRFEVSLSQCAGQAVVQIVEDTRSRDRQAVKFFLSLGALPFLAI